MNNLVAAIISLLFCSQSLLAQNVCESILKSANYNQFQSVSQNQQYSLQKANFCLAEYENASTEQKAQIEASYKLFSGGASGSQVQIRERQRQECDSKYGEYWFNQLGLINQKIVSDKAMDTVAQCIEAMTRGLRVEPTFTESEEALSVSLTWSRSNALPFKGIIRAPSTNVSCKLEGQNTENLGLFNNRTISPGTSVTFTCERTAKYEKISGEMVRCLPPALVAIDVLENPVTLNLFRRCDTDYLISRAADVDKKLSVMGQRLSDVQKQNELINSQLLTKGISRFLFSSNGRIPDMECVQIEEPADPNTWNDNFLCYSRQ